MYQERKSTLQELRENKKLYITVILLVVFIGSACLLFTLNGLLQPFDSLVNDSNSEEIEDDGGSLSYETESVADYTDDEDDTKQAEKFQFIHITDTHGWVFGHPHDERYNTDFGDFVSLVEHMQSQQDKEVLLIDSGDIIEGTGFSDISGVHGEYVFPVFRTIPGMSAMTIGNHDIGRSDSLDEIESTLVSYFNRGESATYLTSNSRDLNGDSIGENYSLYETKMGSKILLLGFLYDFKYYADNASVMNISSSVEEEWFHEAMNIDNIDMIVVTAHVDPSSSNLDDIYNAIREYHAELPLIIFSGHRHVLFSKVLDSNAYTIESGRYFEHIGIVEFDLIDSKIENYNRTWYETSKDNFYLLSGKSEEDFLTSKGQETKDLISRGIDELGLWTVLGCSAQSYSPSSYFSDSDSLYRYYLDEILPRTVANQTLNTPFFVANSASLRYDLFEGEVNMNDVYTIDPFKDEFYYIPNIPGNNLISLISAMNSKSVSKSDRTPYSKDVTKQIESYVNFYYASLDIDEEQNYDFICMGYDADKLLSIYAELYPENNPTIMKYPTELDSTEALLYYFIHYSPCTTE